MGWIVCFVVLAPAQDVFEREVRPVLEAHCYACHSAKAEKLKGNFRLDRVPADFAGEAGRAAWQAVLEQVDAGEMPPKAKPRPSERDLRALTGWIRAQAAARRAAQGRTVLRRLNRAEYENSIRDLLGVEVDLQELLPPDGGAHGFDNVGAALHVSSFLMERYLEAADVALDAAVSNGRRPPTLTRRLRLQDERAVKTATERVYRTTDDAVILFSSSPWNAINLWSFYPPDRGRYRVRITASAVQSDGKPVTFRVDAGPMLMGTTSRLVDYFDATAGAPAVLEFVERLEARHTLRLQPYGLATAQAVHKTGAEAWTGPGLAIHAVEIEGPLHDAWPPPSHRRLFGDDAPAPLVSTAPRADAERILRTFLRRAFRRPVGDGDLKPYLALVEAKLGEKRTFEQAVRAGLQAALVSPDFLFLKENPGALGDVALASRLSYFFWSSIPDDDLLGLAEAGTLGKPDVLRRQVDRLLAHPKSKAFVSNFTGQWLGLRDIDFTLPSHILYPDYDEMLKASMVRETELFFAELLRDDLALSNLLASDFSMLNGRLAKHYGIPGVEGWTFRKVPLPPGSRRGGVLTMASVLKVTANGTTTSPVLRGAWVLDRILGTPPPRPPADVPAVEPDIRGAVTIREQLAKHRNVEACAGCHLRIDPPGFALENFDVIGGWREHYRTTGRGEAVMIDGRRMPYLKGPKVDAGDVTPDGRAFKDVDEFKRLLLEKKDDFARALAAKLVTYATGAAPEPADRPALEALVRGKPEGLRSLVHEIVQSPLFRSK